MQNFEKLGVFYLGRLLDANGTPTDTPLLYDARDLTTHAVCVGMTGSGKTGLCLALLEEAALDGVPAIAVDPKGDLGNLLLAFPDLSPQSFRPWIDESEAARQGLSLDAHAASVAATWKKGLADWGQDGARIARFLAATDVAIYTPGSNAGLPLTVLRSFTAPPADLTADVEAFRERITTSVSSLLALLGVHGDPVQSREHVLLASLLDRAWREGRNLELAQLIQQIQSPPLTRVGVMDLESFFPAKERTGLALRLNNLLASPGFAGWLEGESLDIDRLLFTPEGKPRLSILSIAHLPDAERMFFVTILLNEIVAWTRRQSGTGSLRALLYMDEAFGYFPPVANPPSKTPMLTLLKQARAYGLGVVLATQNPVDLDYKGLSNAGTWLLGRLQTERDTARVLEGLEGASAAAGRSFDKGRMEATLGGLKSRSFLMNNVHEDEPVLFQSRWAMSYLRGPLTRSQIQTLMAPRKVMLAAARAGRDPVRPAPPPAVGAGQPAIPTEIPQYFTATPAGAYRPALLGRARAHYVDKGVDIWRTITLLAPLRDDTASAPWAGAKPLCGPLSSWRREPEPGVAFAPLLPAASRSTSYAPWAKSLADHVYRAETLELWRSATLGLTSKPDETQGDFKARVALAARERRDGEVDKLRARYASRFERLRSRIETAEGRRSREQSQYDQQKLQTAVSLGATVLGALFGRKVASAGNIGRATTTARGVGRAAREREDVARAEDSVDALRKELAALEHELEEAIATMEGLADPSAAELTAMPIRPRKTDVAVEELALAWV